MRTRPVPVLVAVLLLGLVYLLPGRTARPPEDRLITLLRTLDPNVTDPTRRGGFGTLELTEPPAWALQRGTDEITRNFDRLLWGGHGALVAARDALDRHAGTLADEILSRLEAAGDSDPIFAGKLIPLLAREDPAWPGLLDTLIRSAHSPQGLVSKAALRVLARHPDPTAMAGIYPRLSDPDPSVFAVARAALAIRAQDGHEQARQILVEELERLPTVPDLAYLAALESFDDERSERILRSMAEERQGDVRLIALTALMKRGDAWASTQFEQVMAKGDDAARMAALRAIAASGKLVGRASWRAIAEGRDYQQMLLLAELLWRALASGPEDAALALGILEDVATDPRHPAHVRMTSLLFRRGHAWAVEQTRRELQHATGAQLGETVDRIVAGSPGVGADFVALALERLKGADLPDADRVLLCRVLAWLDPERAAPIVVRYALERDGVSRAVADGMLSLLGSLGSAGLRELASEADSDTGAVLLIFTSVQLESGQGLPMLEEIATSTERHPVVRREALDAIVRVKDGPREEVLRRVADGLQDPALRARARLLFWNYL